MNRALPEMLHCLNASGNCSDTMTVLERQRARIKWQQEQFLHQNHNQNADFFNRMDFGPGFGPVLPDDQLPSFHGFLTGADSSLVDMVMASVKPDPGLNDGWTEMGKFDTVGMECGAPMLVNAAGYELNSSISRTSSCPPTVAAVTEHRGGVKDSNTNATGKLTLPVGRESFKKRKADKVHNISTKAIGEEDGKEKRMKASVEEGESKTTDQNSTKNNSTTTTTTTNNKETSADTSKENSKASEVQKPDYIHVRARRGQATDSHSLAERARREKISERMKYLQDLVPGCNKITGKAGMLDEIINYVQSLQRQVEFLSMKLATVNPRLDFNVEDLFTKEVFPPSSANFPSMGISSEITDPSSYLQFNPNTQQMVSCCGLEMGINPSDVGLRRTISAPVSFPENFLDSSCLTQFQPSSAWEVDLQNLYNVGFDQGRSNTNPFSSQPYTGSIEGSNIKMEM